MVLPSAQAPWLRRLQCSGVASPKIGKGKKIWGVKMFDCRRITLFCLGKRLSKHKITIFSKNFGGPWPLCSPGYTYAPIFMKRSVLSVFIDPRSAEYVCLYYGLRVCSQTNKLNEIWISYQTEAILKAIAQKGKQSSLVIRINEKTIEK